MRNKFKRKHTDISETKSFYYDTDGTLVVDLSYYCKSETNAKNIRLSKPAEIKVEIKSLQETIEIWGGERSKEQWEKEVEFLFGK